MTVTSILVIAAIVDGVVCAGFASVLARQKGYDGFAWGAAGLFFGIIGLIAAAGLPVKQEASKSSSWKTCPDCAEPIRRLARICKYCQRRYTDEELLESLLRDTKSENVDIQLDAIRHLGQLKGDKALAVLNRFIEEASDQYASERIKRIRACLDALDNYGESKKRESIIEVLTKLDTKGKVVNPDVYSQLAGELEEVIDEASLPLLIEELERDPSHASYLQGCFLQIRDEALPALEKLQGSSDRAIAKAASRIINAMSK